MGRRRRARATRPGLLAGLVAAALVIVTAGTFTVVRLASAGTKPTGNTGAAPAQNTPTPDTAASRAGGSAGVLRNGTKSPSPKPTPAAPPAAAAAPAFFGTLPPGAALPSGAQCARWVLARPSPENKGANQPFNRTTGQHVGGGFFPAGDTPQAGQLLAPRIDGDFTGTTSEILRWAACKWGINAGIVFAQAAVESWWNQTTLGDWDSDASACPPGHGLGADGKPGQCPQSYGILQNRYPFEQASWPGIGSSTAMNADTAYAIWRSCYDGYETWLNNVPHGTPYAAGDAWGCVGRWFAGRWHTAAADQYVAKVRQYLSERIWTTPDFQQPG
ncbi:MAG TPA: hypothetical protein VGJ50_12180 [Streptosporangiaceae bacterium]|jgi:autotransporter family porin